MILSKEFNWLFDSLLEKKKKNVENFTFEKMINWIE